MSTSHVSLRLVTVIAIVSIALAAVSPGAAAPPAVAAAEHAARRARVAEALGPNALLVLVAPEPARRNGDAPGRSARTTTSTG